MYNDCIFYLIQLDVTLAATKVLKKKEKIFHLPGFQNKERQKTLSSTANIFKERGKESSAFVFIERERVIVLNIK